MLYLHQKNYEITLDEVKIGLNERTNITVWSGIFRVDLKGIYNTFAKKSIEMGHKVTLFDLEINVDSPELLIVSKLCYGSEQEFEDAASIFLRLRKQKRLKKEYLHDTSEFLDIEDRLELLKSMIKKDITVEELEKEIDNLALFNFDLLNKF